MQNDPLTPFEWRAILSLSSIMALRMIGLFMVVPIFALYANTLADATPSLIGMAMGIYGLTQALCQIPLGSWSDRIGRKPVIAFGLVLFIIGSLMGAFAQHIFWMILARSMQGAGAVGSTILAGIADTTRETQRTKAMAISGISIGFSFCIAMLLGPLLNHWMSMSGLFLLSALFGCIAMGILFKMMPINMSPTASRFKWEEFYSLFCRPSLMRLNLGIFILHTILTANFIVLPLGLADQVGLAANQQWHIYLPSLVIAFMIVCCIINAAKKNTDSSLYLKFSIAILGLVQVFFWLAALSANLILYAISLTIFFSSFSLLEAVLPSLISQAAPTHRKGTVLGIFSSSQFLGIFVGGCLGGVIYGNLGFAGVYGFCTMLAFIWLLLESRSAQYLIVLSEGESYGRR